MLSMGCNVKLTYSLQCALTCGCLEHDNGIFEGFHFPRQQHRGQLPSIRVSSCKHRCISTTYLELNQHCIQHTALGHSMTAVT